jgi:hypothetical protein
MIKMQRKRLIKKGIITGMFFLFLPLFASAQWFMMQEWPGDRTRITLKFLHPRLIQYPFEEHISLFSGIYDLSINTPIKSSNGRVNLEASFPFAVNNIDNQTMSGNFYLGVQWKYSRKKTNSIISVGAYFPTGKDDRWETYFIVLDTDPFYFPKYQGKMTALTINYLTYASLGKFDFGCEMGPAIIMGDEGYMESMAYFHYGFFGSFRTGDFTFRTELAGFVVIASVDENSNIESFTNNIAVGVRYGRGSIRPSIYYMRCLNEEMRYRVKDVLGFQLQFLFK